MKSKFKSLFSYMIFSALIILIASCERPIIEPEPYPEICVLPPPPLPGPDSAIVPIPICEILVDPETCEPEPDSIIVPDPLICVLPPDKLVELDMFWSGMFE